MASIGDSGSWFFSWAVSSFMNICWSPTREFWASLMLAEVALAAEALEVALVLELELDAPPFSSSDSGWVTALTGLVMALATSPTMLIGVRSSDPDVQAALPRPGGGLGR